jgi:phosphomevalonate kinase
MMQDAIVSLRLSLPTITAFTKSDIVDVDIKALLNEIGKKEGVLAELMERLVDFIELTTIPYRQIKISNIKKNRL